MSQYQPMYDSFQRAQQERFVPCSRLNISASVSLNDPVMDEVTGRVKQEAPRRRRTQAMNYEKQKLEKQERELNEFLRREEAKKGPRVDCRVAALVIVAVFLICSMLLLGLQGEVQQKSVAKDALFAQGRQINSEIESLHAEILAKLDVSNVCSIAVNDLNLVRSVDSEAVHLLAVDTRPMGKPTMQVIASTEDAPLAQAEK